MAQYGGQSLKHLKGRKEMTQKRISIKNLIKILVCLCLTLLITIPFPSYASTDTMTNRSVIVISDNELDKTVNVSEKTHNSPSNQYPKTNEIKTFTLSLLGTIILAIAIFFLFTKRRRKEDEEE